MSWPVLSKSLGLHTISIAYYINVVMCWVENAKTTWNELVKGALKHLTITIEDALVVGTVWLVRSKV